MGKLYEGGWEVVRAEHLQALWKEKYDEWLKRPKAKLPKCSASVLARNQETPTLLMMRRMLVVQMLPLLMTTQRKKKKRRRKKRKKKRQACHLPRNPFPKHLHVHL